MQSGKSLTKKPRTPLEAASMAAYSRRRVESDVQYWIVAGGGGGGAGDDTAVELGEEVGGGEGSLREGN